MGMNLDASIEYVSEQTWFTASLDSYADVSPTMKTKNRRQGDFPLNLDIYNEMSCDFILYMIREAGLAFSLKILMNYSIA